MDSNARAEESKVQYNEQVCACVVTVVVLVVLDTRRNIAAAVIAVLLLRLGIARSPFGSDDCRPTGVRKLETPPDVPPCKDSDSTPMMDGRLETKIFHVDNGRTRATSHTALHSRNVHIVSKNHKVQ